MSVRTALEIINQELDPFLAESKSDVAADTRFYINWFKQFGFDEANFRRADVLVRAKNTRAEGPVNASVLVVGAGQVRLCRICDRKGWGEAARDYNILVQS